MVPAFLLPVYYQSNEWAGIYGIRERDQEAWTARQGGATSSSSWRRRGPASSSWRRRSSSCGASWHPGRGSSRLAGIPTSAASGLREEGRVRGGGGALKVTETALLLKGTAWVLTQDFLIHPIISTDPDRPFKAQNRFWEVLLCSKCCWYPVKWTKTSSVSSHFSNQPLT